MVQAGLLVTNRLTNQLPTREQLNLRPNRLLLRPETQEDFVAGDDRVNEHPFLTSMHVIFVREHNRVAAGLRRNLPPYLRTDETIYQVRAATAVTPHIISHDRRAGGWWEPSCKTSCTENICPQSWEPRQGSAMPTDR